MNKKKIAFITRICIVALLVIALAVDAIVTGVTIASNNKYMNSIIGSGGNGGEKTEVIDETSGGEGITDHVFEAEAAKFSGNSGDGATDYGHACASQSYAVDAGFSGGICLRNIASSDENNKFTFNFNSDKAVRCIMQIRLAAYGTGASTRLSAGYKVLCNDKDLSDQTLLCAINGTSGEMVMNSAYFYMHTVELEIELKIGENNIVFQASGSANNFDCINILTSANLTGFVPEYWDMSCAAIVSVPTLDSAGTIRLEDGHGIPRTMSLASLLSGVKSGMYTTKTEDGQTTFYLGESSLEIVTLPEEEAYKELTDLRITAAPIATNYAVGEVFDTTGMEVTAYYNNGLPAVVTDYTYEPSGALTLEDTEITVSYTEDGITKTAAQTITVAEEIPAVDETNSQDTVAHRFEAETAAFTGTTTNEASASTRSGYTVDAGFSGNVALRNLASTSEDKPNTLSFAFTSDKAVICNMVMRIASLGTGAEATTFADHATLTVNGNEADTSQLIVPDKESGTRVYSDSFYMHDIVVPVTLKQGLNTITFTFAAGTNNTYNMDYIELFTTAELGNYRETPWDLSGVTVTVAPTSVTTGQLSVKATSVSVLAGITYVLPDLTSEMYETETDDNEVISYYLNIAGTRIFITDSNVAEGLPVKLDLGSYVNGTSGSIQLSESRNSCEVTEGEYGNLYSFSGAEGAMFRDLTAYPVSASVSYTITYTVKNLAEESISFTLCQTNSTFTITDFKEDITLEAGEVTTVDLTFTGFTNNNIIMLIKLNQQVTDGKLGVYAYIAVNG